MLPFSSKIICNNLILIINTAYNKTRGKNVINKGKYGGKIDKIQCWTVRIDKN